MLIITNQSDKQVKLPINQQWLVPDTKATILTYKTLKHSVFSVASVLGKEPAGICLSEAFVRSYSAHTEKLKTKSYEA